MRKRVGGEWYKERGKCNIEARIDFTVPKLVSLDTPYGLITKLLEKCLKNVRKIREKFIFPAFCRLIQKLYHNSGLHAKNQREISSNKVRRLLWPLGGEKCGKAGGKWYEECIKKSRIEFSDPMLMTLDTPHGPNIVFEKMSEKCGEN